jgi:hypothetical protein
MMISLLAAVALAPLPASSDSAVLLERVHKVGEKLQYQFRSQMIKEVRTLGLHTWMPHTYRLNYDFNTEVVASKVDGIVDMKYSRPNMIIIEAETYDTPSKTHTEKLDWNLMLTKSPVNEILEQKNLNPPAKPGTGTKGGKWASPTAWAPAVQGLSDMIGPFVQEIERLALFAGNVDSGLDFAPKLPLHEVTPGETWKRTVGYSPQILRNTEGQMAVQRLDYVYTYVGVVDSAGKKVHRITGQLDLDTDLAEFIHQATGWKAAQTGLKEIKLKLNSKLEFDLDLNTRHTLEARGTSEGMFNIVHNQYPGQALQEEKLRGRTTLTLTSRK